MPHIPNWARFLAGLAVGVTAIVIPETGWLSQDIARLITVICLVVIVLLVGPPVIRWLFPRVRVQIESPPAIEAWRSRRRSPPKATDKPSQFASAEPPTAVPDVASVQGAWPLPAAPWMSDVLDLSTFEMTEDQLDDCEARALEDAKERLAPDASVTFQHIHIGPPTAYVVFEAKSEIAARRVRLEVYDVQVAAGEISSGESGSEKPQIPIGPPWRVDTQWRDLIRFIWYRVRPLQVALELNAWPIPGREPPEWSVWFADVFQAGADRPFLTYGLHNGVLDDLGRG